MSFQYQSGPVLQCHFLRPGHCNPIGDVPRFWPNFGVSPTAIARCFFLGLKGNSTGTPFEGSPTLTPASPHLGRTHPAQELVRDIHMKGGSIIKAARRGGSQSVRCSSSGISKAVLGGGLPFLTSIWTLKACNVVFLSDVKQRGPVVSEDLGCLRGTEPSCCGQLHKQEVTLPSPFRVGPHCKQQS